MPTVYTNKSIAMLIDQIIDILLYVLYKINLKSKGVFLTLMRKHLFKYIGIKERMVNN